MNVIVDATWLIPPLIMVTGIGVGYAIHRVLTRARSASDERRATRALEDARAEANAILQQAALDARTKALHVREHFEQEQAERLGHLRSAEQKLVERETSLEQRSALLERREAELSGRRETIDAARSDIERARSEIEQTRGELRHRIEAAAHLDLADARAELRAEAEQSLNAELEAWSAKRIAEARVTAESRAKEIILTAIERHAAPQVSGAAATALALPSEEMKGRIIGKDGRNIRSLENELGCGVVIDETPRTVTLSCFDPIRREIARRTLLRLVEDGRIHPARIEETAAAARTEVADAIREAGEAAFHELRLPMAEPEVVEAVGRLNFRHSYTQNVLRHSIEVARLMGLIAPEVGLDPALARRVGLLHDIGKALDHEVEGGHAEIGGAFLAARGEAPKVVAGVAGHHPGVDAPSAYAALCSAADAMTAARPGARLDSAEAFAQRMAGLETLARSFPGVAQCYAAQAGRELRVLVHADRIDDAGALRLARDLARAVETQAHVPGQVKVTVIRETRCVEFAR
jgi:ribonucrease Y